MCEVKFTPGPWFVHNGVIPNDKNGGGWTGTYDILNKDGYENGVKMIGDVKPYGGRFPDRDEAAANAKLIASAPDLYEAIQCALNLKDLWSAQQKGTVSADHEGEMQALKAMQDKLESALKKATA